MTSGKMYGWLSAVEFLITSSEGCFVENDLGYSVIIGNMCGGRYEKYNRSLEFCGVVDSAAEAVLWLYENDKADEEL